LLGVVETGDFSSCASLKEVSFEPESHMKVIHGLRKCGMLQKIEIAALVSRINFDDFRDCRSFKEIVSDAKVQLKVIHGFMGSGNVEKIDIPLLLKSFPDSADVRY
jgi:hypothetical protein